MLSDEIKEKINEHYQKGQGSIQDIARVYNVSVETVLDIIGIKNISSVSFQGDLIDPSEVGPGATFNYSQEYRTNYTTN